MARQYTPMKYEYDFLAASWFRSRGYVTQVLGSPCYADVVAYHPGHKRFAVCEVKSPRERDAMVNWETEYNTKGLYRPDVLELIRKHPSYSDNPGLWRLYAFTVTSQLYTYYRTGDAHVEMFRKYNNPLLIKDFRSVTTVACLCLPAGNEGIVRKVCSFLRTCGLITKTRAVRNDPLLVMTIIY